MPQSSSSRATSRDPRDTFQSTPYDSIKPGKPPIPITIAPTPSSARLDLHPSLRPRRSPESSLNGVEGIVTTTTTTIPRSKHRDDLRRDSGMASSNSTARESRATYVTDTESAASLKKSQSLPRIKDSGAASPPQSARRLRRWSGTKSQQRMATTPEKAPRLPEAPFAVALSTEIPTISFEDLTKPDKIEFSKRGSMLIRGKKANEAAQESGDKEEIRPPQQPTIRVQRQSNPSISLRNLTPDEEMLSRKVRSMYENASNGEMPVVPETTSVSSYDARENTIEEAPSESDAPDSQRYTSSLAVPSSQTQGSLPSSPGSYGESFSPSTRELAGGIEDWQDVQGDEVDRYGFISLRSANNASSNSLPAPGQLHRVSTVLQLASEAPRRQPSSRLGRSSSRAKSHTSLKTSSQNGGPLQRPVSSQSSYKSTTSARSSKVRAAANRLPHNRERRYMDEAGDMLTLPPGLADIAENEEGGKMADTLRRKEWEREAKWRKMAKVVNVDKHGGGMTFGFDVTNPKLIERTWKGIPDRWRATAWHAFLSASAKKKPGSATDDELRAVFNELVDQSSADDMQIDIDVPRTISSHIMFRKRYRGGQRLLFRVLHCMSLYFPDTGYVQGMAALAATFLCYYDEEMAFIMLVRMWQLRGLEQLYKAGFAGLMAALEEFEKRWLKDGAVGKKLDELGISPTAYGTRWYLTIFNYSIPFPAQLRVWDVFLLLGDADPSLSHSPSGPPLPPSSKTTGTPTTAAPPSYNGGLDVLHATSAALIDGTREILLDSDFENAMKVLTSWIPIRDEELLMRVAKVEWKLHRKRR